MKRHTHSAGSDDEGFSLVEVIAALVLLAIVATAAAYFFISGTRTSSHLQRTQNAVAVANEAMEMAFAMEPRDSLAVPGLTSLAVGRSKAEVDAAWASASAAGAIGLDQTYPVWDSTAVAATPDALPLTMTREYSGQQYHVTLLVGTCFRFANNVGTDEDCTKLSGFVADPGDNPAGVSTQVARMLRIIALVTWEAKAGECPGDVCSYQLSGLIDRNQDIRWDTSLSPVAVDDLAPFDRAVLGSATSIDINVLMNDIYSRLASYPVRIESQPVPGCGSVAADATTGTVTYTYTGSGSGICTFTYSLKDGQGTVSRNEGIVTVPVLPIARNDVVNSGVTSGVAASMNVTANDTGTYASVEVVTAPAHGTTSVSGLNVVYTSDPDYAGQDSLKYRFTDTSGQWAEALVNISVASFPVQDWTVAVPGRPVGPEVWKSIEETIMTGVPSPSDYRINIVGARPAAGILQVDGSATTVTGTDVNFSPPAATAGSYSFQYTLTRIATGWTSLTKTVTLVVSPLPVLTAVPDAIGNVNDNVAWAMKVGANDTPTTFPAASVTVTFTLPPKVGGNSCGSIAAQTAVDLEGGYIRVTTPNLSRGATRTCSFTYTLVGKGTLLGLTSGPVTVTYTVVGT